MKRILILLVLITSTIYSQNKKENLDCSSFKLGKYKIVDELNGDTFIERTSNFQIEENKEHKYKIKLSITWVDNCTYQLKAVEDLMNPQNKNLPEMILTCKILEKTKNGYLQISSSNISEITLKKEVIKL